MYDVQIHKTEQFIGKMERHNLNAYHVQFINAVDWFNRRWNVDIFLALP